jgi:hypothetical protein
MLQAHATAYGCECTQSWWTYYRPGGVGWRATDAAADPALPDDAPAPRWRYHHLVADADTDRTEQELERLSATGWEVVTFAIVPQHGAIDPAAFIYLLRKPVADHDG